MIITPLKNIKIKQYIVLDINMIISILDDNLYIY
jgi:hypothetical protein